MNLRAWLRGGRAVREAVQARAAEAIADAQIREDDVAAKRAAVAISAKAAAKSIATQLHEASVHLAAASPPPSNGVGHA